MNNANVLMYTLRSMRIFFKCKFTLVLTSLGSNCCLRERGGVIIKHFAVFEKCKFYNYSNCRSRYKMSNVVWKRSCGRTGFSKIRIINTEKI